MASAGNPSGEIPPSKQGDRIDWPAGFGPSPTKCVSPAVTLGTGSRPAARARASLRSWILCAKPMKVPMVGAAVAQQAKAPLHVLVTAGELKWGEPLAPDDWSQINRLGEYYLDNGHKRRSSRLGGANPEMIEGRDSEGLIRVVLAIVAKACRTEVGWALDGGAAPFRRPKSRGGGFCH